MYMLIGNIDIATIVTIVTIVVIVTFITFVTNTTIVIIWTIVTFITNVTKVTIVTIVIIVTTVTIITTILIICLCSMGSTWPISILGKHEKMQKCKFHANFEPRELILSSCTLFRFELRLISDFLKISTRILLHNSHANTNTNINTSLLPRDALYYTSLKISTQILLWNSLWIFQTLM